MKKFPVLAMSAFMGACALMFAACGEKKHNWSEEWKHNAQSHWHVCTDSGCNEREVFEHSDWTLVETIEEPTCFTRGRGTFACGVCGETKEDYIEPTGIHVAAPEAEWESDANSHWKKCGTAGCRAKAEESAHTIVTKQLNTQSSYEDGITAQICSVCGYIESQVVHPATAVPVEFEIHLFNIVGDGSNFRSSDEDPTIENLGKMDEDGVSTTKLSANIVRDPDSTVSYRYRLNFTKGVNGSGERVTAFPEYESDTKTGVQAWLVNAHDPTDQKVLDVQNVSTVTYLNNILRVKVTGDYIISFRFYVNGVVKSRTDLTINVMEYSEWKASLGS